MNFAAPIPKTHPDADAWNGFLDFHRVNTRRSMMLFALGALTGLGIAGFGLLTSKGTSTRIVPPENVALVNHRPILRTDFIAQAETQYSEAFSETTLPERLRVLDDMIREELFVQRGLELDFPGTDPDTRTALVAAVEQQVVADVTTHEPTDAELRSYFLAHEQTYASEGLLTVRDLFIAKSTPDAMAKAQAAAALLRSGTPPDAVKKDEGLSEKGGGDEQFYFAAKIHMGDALFAKASALNVGSVLAPLETETGVHIVLVEENKRPVLLTFERARQKVLNDFKNAEQRRLEESDERYLRGKAEILIADDYASAYGNAVRDENAMAKKPEPKLAPTLAPGK